MEKKPPLATPLIITNIAKEARDVEFGQITNIVKAFNARQIKSVLSAPIRSQNRPHITRPIAEEKLKPARRPAPVDDDRPTDLLYNGRKKGGTSNGNVAIAPARKMVRNPPSLNKFLGREVSVP